MDDIKVGDICQVRTRLWQGGSGESVFSAPLKAIHDEDPDCMLYVFKINGFDVSVPREDILRHEDATELTQNIVKDMIEQQQAAAEKEVLTDADYILDSCQRCGSKEWAAQGPGEPYACLNCGYESYGTLKPNATKIEDEEDTPKTPAVTDAEQRALSLAEMRARLSFTEFLFDSLYEMQRSGKIKEDDPVFRFACRFDRERDWPMHADNQEEFREYLMKKLWFRVFSVYPGTRMEKLIENGDPTKLTELMHDFQNRARELSYTFDLAWRDYIEYLTSSANGSV